MEPEPSAHASFRHSATSSDAPNPLRPYYVPPSIGLPPDPVSHTRDNATNSAAGRYISRPTTPPRPKGSSLRSSAREFFPDLDYADYLPERSPSMAETVKSLMDQAIWNYTSVLLAQPFEVAKTVLQCHLASSGPGIVAPKAQRGTSAYGSASGSGYSSRSNGYGKGLEDVRSENQKRHAVHKASLAAHQVG
jgi:mitochondrial fusion and transport protein UGO1